MLQASTYSLRYPYFLGPADMCCVQHQNVVKLLSDFLFKSVGLHLAALVTKG